MRQPFFGMAQTINQQQPQCLVSKRRRLRGIRNGLNDRFRIDLTRAHCRERKQMKIQICVGQAHNTQHRRGFGRGAGEHRTVCVLRQRIAERRQVVIRAAKNDQRLGRMVCQLRLHIAPSQ
ncbi:MAG: hypothetical protein BWZ07_02517 [Alphaproteobacteria bacterium ADurb.BinA280]|nr:MAG: hypothetical protein BWZ07_02517 [Alphaproteobacteria bacterium ADurb.BinA280]